MRDSTSATDAFVPISALGRLKLVLGLAVVLFGTYGLVGAVQQSGLLRGLTTMHQLPTVVDGWVPFSAPWVLAYGGLYALLFAPVVAVRDRRVAMGAALGMSSIVAAAVPLWLLWPVTRLRPEVLPEGVFGHAVSVIYALDPPNNCFPSMHVATTLFAGRCVWRHDRVIGALTLLLALGVWYSSIAIAQHWFLDGLAGAALALLADAWAYRGLPRTAFPAGPRWQHFSWALLWAALFAGVASTSDIVAPGRPGRGRRALLAFSVEERKGGRHVQVYRVFAPMNLRPDRIRAAVAAETGEALAGLQLLRAPDGFAEAESALREQLHPETTEVAGEVGEQSVVYFHDRGVVAVQHPTR